DQVGDVEAILDIGDQLVGRLRARCEIEVTRPRRGHRRYAAMRVRSGLQAKLARGRAIKEPTLEHAVFDQLKLARGDPFRVERPRAQAALAQWIIDYGDAAAEQPLAELVAQETGLACDCGAIRGIGEMTDQRSGNPRIEYDRHTPRLNFAWIEPLHRAL